MHIVLGTMALGILVLFIAPAQAVPAFILRRPSSQVRRLRALLKAKALLHPCCSEIDPGVNFCHLASALARCCGVHAPELARYSQAERLKVEKLADEIGGMSRQHVVRASCRMCHTLLHEGEGLHITLRCLHSHNELRQVFVLCDGLGTSVIEEHLGADSFLARHNQAERMRSVFPSTTPAALTTLATAAW